jgi:hypothetical protein
MTVANYVYSRFTDSTTPALNATAAIKVGTYGLLANGVKRGRLLFQNLGSSSLYLSPNGPFSSSTQGFVLPPGDQFSSVLDIRNSDDSWFCLGSGANDEVRILESI